MRSLHVCNPFQRKPNGNTPTLFCDQERDPCSDFDIPNVKKAESLEDFDGLGSESAGFKKRKRDNRKGGSEGDVETIFKEQRDGDLKKLNRVQYGIEGNVMEVVDKRKKRKRDKVVTGYEARRCGVVDDEEAGQEERKGVLGMKMKEIDSLKDVMEESKEGLDNERKLLRAVFMGKKVLFREFGKFGEVESVRIRFTPLNVSKIPRKSAIIKKPNNENVDNVLAYVLFKIEESTQAFLAHNMVAVGENYIRVRVCLSRKRLKRNSNLLYDTNRTTSIRNLASDVKDEELYSLSHGSRGLAMKVEVTEVIKQVVVRGSEWVRDKGSKIMQSLRGRDEEKIGEELDLEGVMQGGLHRKPSLHSDVKAYPLNEPS